MDHRRILGENIKRLRKAKGWSQDDLAHKVGIHRQHLYRIEKGKSGISDGLLGEIARALETDISSLYQDPDLGSLPSMRGEVEGPYTLSGKILKIPVVAEVRAGQPRETLEEATEFVYVDADLLPNGFESDYIAVRVQGDSMSGVGISEGDLAIVRRQPIIDSGQIAAVHIEGEGSCIKRIHFSGDQVVLISENPKYPPRVLGRDMVRVVGRVRRVVKEF